MCAALGYQLFDFSVVDTTVAEALSAISQVIEAAAQLSLSYVAQIGICCQGR